MLWEKSTPVGRGDLIFESIGNPLRSPYKAVRYVIERHNCCSQRTITGVSGTNLISAFVVDDETVIASTVSTILNMSGFSASPYFCAEDAIAAAAELGAPNLLITDVSMPGMNGIELAVRFEADYPECKVLLFSGQASTLSLLEEAWGAGHHFQMLAKPVHPKDLLAAVHKLSQEK